MDFRPARRKPRAESIVPMINVVFLLLVFFLMTAQISQPDPFEIDTPVASSAAKPTPQDAPAVLYLGQDGTMQFLEHTGPAAMQALAALPDVPAPLKIRIDARLDGDRLAQVMRQLTQLGVNSVEIVVAKE